MARIEYIVDSQGIRRAFERAPELVVRHLGGAIRTMTNRIARDAKRRAPKAFSQLTNSIIGRMVSPLTGEVTPGTNYARMVEEGTGPGGRPPLRVLEDWIRVKGIRPRDPSMSTTGLAIVMADAIAKRGTPAQPYLVPAYEANRAELTRRVDDAIDKVLQGMRSA